MSSDTNRPTSPHRIPRRVHVVLVPGYWLGAWAWEAVEPACALLA